MGTIEPGVWQVVTNEREFRELQPEWDELFRNNQRHSPFQTWTWVAAWLKYIAGPHELHIICWRCDEGQLQFVLPLIFRKTGRPLTRSRIVLVCSYGTECSDHIGCLSLLTHESRIAEFSTRALNKCFGDSVRIELGNLSTFTNYPDKLKSRVQEGGRIVRLTKQAICPVVDLPTSWEEYLQRLSVNFRSQIRRTYKRIVNDDNLTFRSVAVSDASSFTHELIRLNRKRIADKGETSSLENEKFRRFLHDAIPGMAANGIAWMDELMDGEKVVATALNFVWGDTVYYYLGGFADGAKGLRPGTALFALAMKRCIENGISRYDFLRGAEHYKYRWGAKDTYTYHLDVYPSGVLRGQLACAFDDIYGSSRSFVSHVLSKLTKS